MKLKKLDKSEKFVVGCGCTAVFGLIFGWAIFPSLLNVMLKKMLTLAKGTELRDMWTIIPFALDFQVYLFNYTNPYEIMNGAKPILKEIGPYYFEEWKTKVNLEDIEEEDAIYYNRQDFYYFNKKKSGKGLTGNEKIYMPHILIIGIMDTVTKRKPEFLRFVKKAIDGVFDHPKTIFTEFVAMDFMFNGVVINCNQTEFAPKAMCTVMKKEKSLSNVDDRMTFSVFGLKNGTVEEEKFKVLRGKKNIMDVGRVIEHNGTKSMTVWRGSPCNDYVGTDATIFPPFLTEKDDIESFSPEICRSLPAKYEKKSAYAGIKANRYVADFGDLPNEPDHNCFCVSPLHCPKKGLMDLGPCIGAPLMASMPHFLNADPSVLEKVIGLKPDVEKHGIEIDFEPITGTPLQAKKRIQFNVVVPHLENNELFSNFHDDVLPFLWIEEGLALNKTFIGMLNKQLFYILRFVTVLKWCLVVFGSVGFVAALLYNNRERLSKFSVNPTDQNKTIGISTVQNTQHT